MKQAPALRSNNQTHPPRPHRPWHRRTRSPRSAVGTTAPGRPATPCLVRPTCVNGCQFVSTAGGGMAAECHRHWSGSLLGMLGDIGVALAGLSLVGQVAVGEWAAVVMLMLAKAVGARRGAAVRAGVGLCARGCQQGGCGFVPPLPDRLGRIPGGQTGNFRKFQEMDSVSLRFATCDGDCDSVPLLAGCPPFKVFPGNQSWRRAGGGPEQKVRFVGSIRFR